MTRVLIDTSAWIDLFQRGRSPVSDAVAELVDAGSACAHGIIRAELLSGCRTGREYDRLSAHFSSIPLLDDPPDLWDRVAMTRFRLARKGVQAAITDLVIALVAEEHKAPLFTLDRDYALFTKVIGLELLTP